MKVKTLTGLLAGVLVAAIGLWPTEGLTMNSDANKIYVPRGGDERQKLPKNPRGWEVIRDVYAPIGDIADWQKLVEKRHWKPGKSAHQTALSWFNANPELPREINALLGGAELLAATPEHETPLPGKGSGSHSDVFAFVNMRGARCAVTVEGKKTTDDFDDTVEVWFEEAKTENARDNRTKRLNGIYAELGLTNPAADKIRYQLLHRAAAAVIEAKRFNTDCAAMVVQSFSPQHQGFGDFAEFLKLFNINSAKRDMLYETDMPGMPLYFGWASPPGTVATAATPGKTESQPAQVAGVVVPVPEQVTPSTDSATASAKSTQTWLTALIVGVAITLAFVVAFVVVRHRSRATNEKTGGDAASTTNSAHQEAESVPTETVVSGGVFKTQEQINKENGDTFERQVFRKFTAKHFNVIQTGDKNVDGRFSDDSTDPDFKITCKFGKNSKFAVEAKFTTVISPRGFVKCASSDAQLRGYQGYQRDHGQKTFIVLGVGDPADDPQDVYIIPVEELPTHEMSLRQLKDYKQGNRGSFYFKEGKESLWMMPPL